MESRRTLTEGLHGECGADVGMDEGEEGRDAWD
jgi:hypothetical protein